MVHNYANIFMREIGIKGGSYLAQGRSFGLDPLNVVLRYVWMEK